MKNEIKAGNKVVLKATHWGLNPGDIATVTEVLDQITIRITADGLPSEGLEIRMCDVRRANRGDFAR